MKILHEEYLKVMKVYVASDGTKFYSERDCQNYENQLRMKSVRTEEFDNLYPFFSSFYYIDSIETLEFLKDYQFGGLTETINGNSVKVGDWVTVKFEYNSNGADDYQLITLDEIWTELVRIMNKTEFGDENV